ncbi:hypothetical protein CANARDRAFT_6639 [[Candida] arabinofermentans NRRL YB-2248]|uniref:Transmembrane protein n=1 Tax=[Candida] arabinofermentans NRRL YB-2248 TaxID=983967 RepID=A0A1E4T325_9ASCO|nr:hypothetical protein CANARDRAFT_6639 [[Candida] arabinofermentans NRRL YB-2248]
MTIIHKSRDEFTTSVIIINFFICTIVVCSWLLLMIQILSTNFKPYFLKISTLDLSCSSTVLLFKISTLMKSQYEYCYQDKGELATDIFNRTSFECVYYICELLIYGNWVAVCGRLVTVGSKGGVVGKTTTTTTSSNSPSTSGYSHLPQQQQQQQQQQGKKPSSWFSNLFMFFKWTDFANTFVMFISGIFSGLQLFLHGSNGTGESSENSYWVNICLMIFTSLRYIYIICLFTFFLILKISDRVRFKTMTLITVTILCLAISVGLNLTSLILIQKKIRWLIPIYLFFELLTINLIYEFLSDLKAWDQKKESKGIVGREIQIGNQYDNTEYKDGFLYDDDDITEEEDSSQEEEENITNVEELSYIGSDSEVYELSDMSHHQQQDIEQGIQGSSNDDTLPPFEPHPGFQMDDYWNDKR